MPPAIIIIYILFLISTLHLTYINHSNGNPHLAANGAAQALLFSAVIYTMYGKT